MAEDKGKGKVMVTGLYGLCHFPEIGGLGEGEPYEGAPLWTLNDWPGCLSARFYKPARIYNVHDNLQKTIANLGVDFEKHIGQPYDAMIENGVEIVLSEPCDRFPDATIYPFEEVKQALGVGNWFFSSSIVYQLGHALYEGYSTIGLRGVSMANDDEYFWQAIGVLYAIRLAEKMGKYIDFPLRTWLEERFTEDDYKYLVEGTDGAPPEVKNALYRFEKPYHTLNRYEQEEAAIKALAYRKKIHI